MKKRKQVYLNKITKSGQITINQCPECEGEGVEIGDYEQGLKGLQIWECGLCEGTGRAIKDIDYEITTHIPEGIEYVRFDKLSKGDKYDTH